MINVIQNNDVYQVTFKYDADIVYLVKTVPGRRWHPDGKYWTIPKDKLGFLIKRFKGTPYESKIKIISDEDINVNATLDKTETIPEMNIEDVNFRVKGGSNPYKHQVDFMKFALDRQSKGRRSGFILADGPGLGKTLETSNLAIYNKEKLGFKHCLVICCINSSKFNWKNDIEEHTAKEFNPYILGSRLKRDGSLRLDGGKAKYDDLVSGRMYGNAKADPLPYFIILNIESLRYKVGKEYLITSEIIKWCNRGDINMILIDEIHKNASPSSTQGKQLLKIKKSLKEDVEWIPMTGTPITNKPIDVFLPLKLVDGHYFNSYYKWCQEFCIYGGFGGYEIIGYKNIPRLKHMLQGNMLRRLKSDVLDLPPKIYFTEYVENTPYQEKLYRKVRDDILSNKDEIMRAVNPMAKLLRLRQVNGSPELVDRSISVDDKDYIKKNAKLQKLMDILEEIHANGEKVIVFSNWVEPLRTLYRYISKHYGVCCFTGTMKPEDREKHKHAFQTNPKYTVLLGTIGAAGTTHTFTAATNVIFYDNPWTPSDKEQGEDRAYRIGTNSSVNIYTLITKDTVDERVHEILYTKSGISQYIVDNKLDIKKNPKLFELLLSDSKEVK